MEELPFSSSSQLGQGSLFVTGFAGCDSTIGTTEFEKNISHLNSLTAYTTITVHYIALHRKSNYGSDF